MKNPKRANILEVAEKAGVSAMTVTRVFNDSGSVAEKTRRRIIEAAKELGYQPNLLAKGLRGGKTNSIGVLWSLGGPHFSVELVRNISLKAMNAGYVTYIADSLSDYDVIKKTLNDYINRNVDGLIFQATSIDFLKDKEISEKLSRISALTIVSHEPHDFPCDSIIRNRFAAMEEIASHWIGSGRKRLLAISDDSCIKRVNLLFDAFKKNGLTIDSNSFWYRKKEDLSSPMGDTFLNAFKDAFPEEFPFDAVWCSCDEGAAAVMGELQKRGLRIPEDVSVIGFNNNEISSYTVPPLASVERQTKETAEKAWEFLYNRIRKPEMEKQFAKIFMKFIDRESAG
jgi:LacI family transcriptional regulator